MVEHLVRKCTNGVVAGSQLTASADSMPQFERSQIPSMISMEKSKTGGEHTPVVVDEEVVVDPKYITNMS